MSGFETSVYNVKVKLQKEMLGTVAASKSIWAEHIMAKQTLALKKEGGHTDEQIKELVTETLEGIPEAEDLDEMDKGLTVFLRDKKGIYVEDYWVKGFFKTSAEVMKEWGVLKQLRSKVVNYLFIRPEKIYVSDDPKAKLDIVVRPLRGQTPRGERVCIARSESIPAGTELDFSLHCLNNVITLGCVKDLLSYGQYQGLGQWRGGGCGTFKVVKMSEA
jgi:hypothetical protein